MISKLKFMLEATKNFKTIGSPFPSQIFLAKLMTEKIKKNKKKIIVEFGAGEGCITKKIIEKMNKKDLLISFEINDSLNRELKKKIKNSNVIFIKDDVKNMQEYLEKSRIKKVDYVISSLPLAQMSKEEVVIILNIIKKSMKNKGIYMQYQYSPQSARLLKKTFTKTNIKFMPLNFPPAFIYTCLKK